MSGARLEVVEEESVERFAHEAMLGLADLESEDLTHGNLTVPLGLSLWMRRGRIRIETARDALLVLRRRAARRRRASTSAPSRCRCSWPTRWPRRSASPCTWTASCSEPLGMTAMSRVDMATRALALVSRLTTPEGVRSTRG